MTNFAVQGDSLVYRMMSGYDSKYQGVGSAQSARGFLTGSMTRVFSANNGNGNGNGNGTENGTRGGNGTEGGNGVGNDGLLLRAMYYDLHGNIIQTHEMNLKQTT